MKPHKLPWIETYEIHENLFLNNHSVQCKTQTIKLHTLLVGSWLLPTYLYTNYLEYVTKGHIATHTILL